MKRIPSHWGLLTCIVLAGCTEEKSTTEDESTETGEAEEFVPQFADSLEMNLWIEPHMAGIWNGLVPIDDEGIGFSTMSIVVNNEPMQLTIRHYDWDLNPRYIDDKEFIAVTRQFELPQGDHITDHAIVRLGDSLYFAYTGNVQNYLHMVKTDLNGQREAFRVIYEETPYPANDMILVATDDSICMRIGRDGPQKYAECFDPDSLETTFSTTIETQRATGNLGSAVYRDGEFKVFAGGFDQRTLTMTMYDEQWQPKDPFEQELVPSENRDWNWAASGSTYIPEYDMWAVAYTNMPDSGQANYDSRGRLALFDAEWNLVDLEEFGELATHRPHLLWQDPHLYLSFDAGPVLIRRYELK